MFDPTDLPEERIQKIYNNPLYLMRAFAWSETPQGYKFWNKLRKRTLRGEDITKELDSVFRPNPAKPIEWV